MICFCKRLTCSLFDSLANFFSKMDNRTSSVLTAPKFGLCRRPVGRLLGLLCKKEASPWNSLTVKNWLIDFGAKQATGLQIQISATSMKKKLISYQVAILHDVAGVGQFLDDLELFVQSLSSDVLGIPILHPVD